MKKALQHKIRKETHAKGKQNKHKRGISTPTATGCALRYPFHEAMSCLIPLTPGQRLDDGNALTPGPRIKKVSRNQTMASNPLPFLQTLRGTTTNSTNCIFPYSKRDGVNMKRPDEPSIRPASPSKSQLHRNGNPQSRAKSLKKLSQYHGILSYSRGFLVSWPMHLRHHVGAEARKTKRRCETPLL